jgi:transcriptional regulator with XRE-family HTH domain
MSDGTTLPHHDPRRTLAEFLRSRRTRLSPLEVGLVPRARRRTPGLRREEVAQLAGIGVTWYTWLEQGRDIRVSAHFLENLARALRLNPSEREHLFALAQRRPPPLTAPLLPVVSPVLNRMLESYPHPAYVKTPRWDVVAWNPAAALLFGDFARIPPERRNALLLVFTSPDYRRMMVDREGDARRVVARFRLDHSRAGDDPAFARLLDELLETSPEFRRFWADQDVLGRSEGVKRLRHPEVGEIEFEHVALAVEGDSPLRLVAYMPVEGESAARFARLTAPAPAASAARVKKTVA